MIPSEEKPTVLEESSPLSSSGELVNNALGVDVRAIVERQSNDTRSRAGGDDGSVDGDGVTLALDGVSGRQRGEAGSENGTLNSAHCEELTKITILMSD